MVTVQMGAVKFNSIKSAVAAMQSRNPRMSYMTAYMRLRAGNKVGTALQKPVRKYSRTTNTIKLTEQPLLVKTPSC